jgi:hypothetical protein
MCIKIGGWVRAEYTYGPNGNISWGWANNNVDNRTTNNSVWRSRGYITADARNQTEYGTVRGYLAVGLSTNNVGFDGAANTFSANRAFIQWAGFTFGLCSMTSTAALRRRTGAPSRRPTPATAAGWSPATPRSSAMVSRRRWRPKCAARRRSPLPVQIRRRGPVFSLVSMAASRCLTSWRTSASTRPGVRRRSWARCTRSMLRTMAARPGSRAAIPTTGWVSPLVPASG